jgi:hypothetical protein
LSKTVLIIAHSSHREQERITLLSTIAWDREFGSPLEYWLINDRSWKGPSEPLLQQWLRTGRVDVSRDWDQASPFGPIVQTLELGAVYEVVLINLNSQQHPWHFHGYTVDFVDVGFIRGGRKPLPAQNFSYTAVEKQSANSAAPVLSRGDSFAVPQYGYTVFRFVADNPGEEIDSLVFFLLSQFLLSSCLSFSSLTFYHLCSSVILTHVFSVPSSFTFSLRSLALASFLLFSRPSFFSILFLLFSFLSPSWTVLLRIF